MSSRAIRSVSASTRLALAAVAGTTFLVACAASAPAKKKPADDGNGAYATNGPPTASDTMPLPEQVNEDSGAFGAGARPAKADAGDAGPSDEADAGPVGSCGDSVAPGDLAIVEIMIDSRSGSGDVGEWAEIKNTRNCMLKIKGVSVASPRGALAPDTATVTADIELAPGGTFLVANTTDATKNNGLSGTVIAWGASDVLKNDGDTLAVQLGSVVIDSVTYPDLSNLSPGRSFAFPSDCALADRADWRRWSLTFTEFTPGFQGTPNAPNSDVSCF